MTVIRNNVKSPTQFRAAHCTFDRKLHFCAIQCSTIARRPIKEKCWCVYETIFSFWAFLWASVNVSMKWRWEKEKVKQFQILSWWNKALKDLLQISAKLSFAYSSQLICNKIIYFDYFSQWLIRGLCKVRFSWISASQMDG